MKKRVIVCIMAVLVGAAGFGELVVRKPVKPRLAVVEFSTNIANDIAKADAFLVRDVVESQMIGCGNYEVIAREDIDALLANQKIAVSSISSSENIKKLQLLNIDYIVTGSANVNRNSYVVIIRVLDVSTGKFSHSANAQVQDSNLYGGVTALADKFIGGMTSDETGSIVQNPSGNTGGAGKVYKIGDRGQAGGIVFYDKGNNADGWRYLEAAPQDLGEAEWGWWDGKDYKESNFGPDVSGTSTAIGSGKRNTQLIVDALNRGGYTGKAAQLCVSYSYGGYNDWFLPSKDELDLMYKNLAVKALGGFTGGWYWSSSKLNPGSACHQRFSDGGQGPYGHSVTNTYSVRAVRAF